MAAANVVFQKHLNFPVIEVNKLRSIPGGKLFFHMGDIVKCGVFIQQIEDIFPLFFPAVYVGNLMKRNPSFGFNPFGY